MFSLSTSVNICVRFSDEVGYCGSGRRGWKMGADAVSGAAVIAPGLSFLLGSPFSRWFMQ